MDPRLWEAACNGDTIKLQELINENNYILESCSLHESSQTILHVACLEGHAEFVKVLLKKKADLATRINHVGFSAIHIASANGQVEIVRLLLMVNCELGRLRSSDGRTSLHFAAINGMVPVIRELFDYLPACKDDLTSRGETALHIAVKHSQFEAFKSLVDLLHQRNVLKELLNAGDEDGNTVLHLATAKKQTQTLKLLLDGRDIEKGMVNVNVINKSGFTALDVLDVVQQMVYGCSDDYMLREWLLRAGALRARELEFSNKDITLQAADHISSTRSESPPQNLWDFFLKEIKLINPFRYYRTLAKQVQQTPQQTQNALMVVAVLIATIAYQAILSPPDGIRSGPDGSMAVIAGGDGFQFIIFMASNTTGFFASLAVIQMLVHDLPLKSLLGLALRCTAASYLCGLLLIGPSSLEVTHRGLLGIGIVVLADFVRFTFWLCNRWSRKIREMVGFRGRVGA